LKCPPLAGFEVPGDKQVTELTPLNWKKAREKSLKQTD
jgi:hypothetical protein